MLLLFLDLLFLSQAELRNNPVKSISQQVKSMQFSSELRVWHYMQSCVSSHDGTKLVKVTFYWIYLLKTCPALSVANKYIKIPYTSGFEEVDVRLLSSRLP